MMIVLTSAHVGATAVVSSEDLLPQLAKMTMEAINRVVEVKLPKRCMVPPGSSGVNKE